MPGQEDHEHLALLLRPGVGQGLLEQIPRGDVVAATRQEVGAPHERHAARRAGPELGEQPLALHERSLGRVEIAVDHVQRRELGERRRQPPAVAGGPEALDRDADVPAHLLELAEVLRDLPAGERRHRPQPRVLAPVQVVEHRVAALLVAADERDDRRDDGQQRPAGEVHPVEHLGRLLDGLVRIDGLLVRIAPGDDRLGEQPVEGVVPSSPAKRKSDFVPVAAGVTEVSSVLHAASDSPARHTAIRTTLMKEK